MLNSSRKAGELYVLARSLPRRAKERAMRQKKLKAYWQRLGELRDRETITRDDLLLAIGAAKQKSGRTAHRLVNLVLPSENPQDGPTRLRFELDRKRLKQARLREGQYLLPATLPARTRQFCGITT